MSPVEFKQRCIELLGELKAEVRPLYDDQWDKEEAIITIMQEIYALKTEVAGFKRRASIWGGSMGAMVSAVVTVLKYVFN